MNFRITDSSLSARLATSIGQNRARVEAVQERVSTGKRINRPSDDPFGAEAVLNLRTSQANVEQFQQNALTVRDGLQIADNALESYDQLLDRARSLLAQGTSDSTTAAQRQAIATEIDSVRQGMLNISNTSSQGQYLFGGTRQNVGPFDSAGTPAVALTAQQMVQIEPNSAPIAAGVIAETVFSNGSGTVFASLANAAIALRGTGNPAADRTMVLATMDSLTTFTDQSIKARTQLGGGMNAVDDATTRMQGASFSYQALADRFESADLGDAAVQLTQADRAYQATLQASAYIGRRSLLDFLT
jgi:flagellar hook-associated protein 3 FlgL